MIENTEQTEQTLIFDAQRWGLPQEAIDGLARRLRRIWTRFRECFTTKTMLDWSQQHPRDIELAHQLEVAVLPPLSSLRRDSQSTKANIRELLKAVMPLKQLSPEEATQLVISHLVNRSRSTSCRLKAQSRTEHKNRDP